MLVRGTKQRDRVLTWPSSPRSLYEGMFVCGRDLGGQEESLGIGFDGEPSAWHCRQLRAPQVLRVIMWLPTPLSFPAL